MGAWKAVTTEPISSGSTTVLCAIHRRRESLGPNQRISSNHLRVASSLRTLTACRGYYLEIREMRATGPGESRVLPVVPSARLHLVGWRINPPFPAQFAFELIRRVHPSAPTVLRIRVFKPTPSVVDHNASVRKRRLRVAYYETYSHGGYEEAIPKDYSCAGVVGANLVRLKPFRASCSRRLGAQRSSQLESRAATSKYRIVS